MILLFLLLFNKEKLIGYQKEESVLDPFEFTQDPFSTTAREFSFKEIEFCTGVHNNQKASFRSGHLLQRIENWASSAIGKKIEYSYPLLDKRIIEFALAVPEELYAPRGGHRRYFFSSAISDILPENIAWAVKNNEPEYSTMIENLWDESIRVWMEKNEKTSKNGNGYIDRSKVINRIKVYYTNKKNGAVDTKIRRLIPSILVSNLINKGSD